MILEMLDESMKVDLEVMLTLKIKEFRRDNFKTITKDLLKDYLINSKWKKRQKISVCDIAADVFDVTASEVFDYLRYQGIKESSQMNIEDFSDLISK